MAYAFWLEAHRRAKSNEKDLALTFLLRAVEIDPDFSAALFNISELRSQNRDVNTADIAIERAKSINPDHPKRSIVYQAVDPLPAVRTEMLNSKWQTIGDGLWLKEIRSRLYNLEMVSVKADAGIYGLGVTIADQPMGSTAKALREKTGSVAALPGGFFERDPNNNLSPSGLVIVDKAVIKQVTQGAGTGVLAISEDMTSIADARSSSLSSLTFGLQSGPILVETGGRMGVYRNDRVRLERAAICVNKDILILVFVGGSGLSLYDLSELLVSPEGSGGLGCDSALNLDGGPSAQLSLGSDGRIVEKPGFWRINNALLLKRKDN
ncbi:hypothetical protein J2W73_004436 [Methylorubrum extorquens]|uniref:phosphodiester glycosidase family protein n=1 Tax=Methylorubrum extorquens TaxID=408 RepID=UPI0020A0CA6D|nr:phosphodiester glycosidase family protein [Methylorubrum extorquens]MCP1561084.1 hypothetical protein [Methylorubrum extorquens]